MAVGEDGLAARTDWRERFRNNSRDDLFEFANESEFFIHVKDRREMFPPSTRVAIDEQHID